VLRNVWANYRDESFISQFLSPTLIRGWRFFHLVDDADEPGPRVEAIHDERGYLRVRRALARQYDIAWVDPDIQVVDVDLAGDRRLVLCHNVPQSRPSRGWGHPTLQHLADLWGYGVLLKEIDPANGTVLKEHAASARQTFF
jgi:stage V sporulation protein R